MNLIESLKDWLSPAEAGLSRTIFAFNQAIGETAAVEGWLHRETLPPNRNPILTASDVTDYGFVNFVADPFLYFGESKWHLFFEVQNGRRDPTAVIGHAVSTDAGENWEYDGVVLKYDCHLSFPYVFDYDGSVYMVPDQGCHPSEQQVTLFKAHRFPEDWKPEVTLVDPDFSPLDPVVFQYKDRWWVIFGGGDNDTLYAYYSDSLESSNWLAHAQNPIVTNRVEAGRPAGRPYFGSEYPVIFLQDNTAQYGDSVRAYCIRELTPDSYQDEPVANEPVLSGNGGFGWNSGRMHHIDLQHLPESSEFVWIVDGDIKYGRAIAGSSWSIGVLELTDNPILRSKSKKSN